MLEPDLSADSESITAAAIALRESAGGTMRSAQASFTATTGSTGDGQLDGMLATMRSAWKAAIDRIVEDADAIAGNGLLAAVVYDEADTKLAAEAKKVHDYEKAHPVKVQPGGPVA